MISMGIVSGPEAFAGVVLWQAVNGSDVVAF